MIDSSVADRGALCRFATETLSTNDEKACSACTDDPAKAEIAAASSWGSTVSAFFEYPNLCRTKAEISSQRRWKISIKSNRHILRGWRILIDFP
jgi:hypothetical protein